MVAGVLLAEMFHFQRERVIDFRQMMREMLQEQIKFYREVSSVESIHVLCIMNTVSDHW